MKCSFHLTTSGATWYLCVIVLSMLNTCKVVSIKFPHLQVILFPFPDTLLGHQVQYILHSKGTDFGSYRGAECQRIYGLLLKLVQENRVKEDGRVPGTKWVPGTGCQVRVLGSCRKELKSEERGLFKETHATQTAQTFSEVQRQPEGMGSSWKVWEGP